VEQIVLGVDALVGDQAGPVSQAQVSRSS
jgi:hypothetical protein